MTHPTVSVVMPTYNQADHIRDAVGSVLGQTFGDFELIIVDDGCTDETPEYLGTLPHIDQRVRTLSRRYNLGTAASINEGHELSRGRFVSWVSSDNVMAPEWLELQVAALEAHEEAFVFSPYWRQNGHIKDGAWRAGRAVPSYPPSDDGEFPSKSLIEHVNSWVGPASLYTRELLRCVGDHRGNISHDYDWWLRAEEHTRFRIVNKLLCTYRVHNERVTVKRRETFDAHHWQEEARRRRG